MAQNNFAMVLLRKGKEEEAIAHFQQALKLDSSKFEIYNNLGHSLTVKVKLNESFSI